MKNFYELEHSRSYYRDFTNLTPKEIENIKEKEELVSKVFLVWGMEERSGKVCFHDEEYHKESFIYKVLSKKLDVFQIDVKVPDSLYMIIDICVDGNPLKCQMILHNILMNIPNLKSKPGYIITTQDLLRVYTDLFPIMAYPKLDDEYYKLAQNFKFDERYACDNPKFWDQDVWLKALGYSEESEEE